MSIRIGSLKDIILRFAKALDENGSSPAASTLTRVCDALAGDSQTPLAAVVKLVANAQFPKAGWGGGPRVGAALKPLASLRALLEGQSKADVLKGLDEFAAFLRLAPDTDLDIFVRKVQDAPKLALQAKEEAARQKAAEAARKKEEALRKQEEVARRKAEKAAEKAKKDAQKALATSASQLPPFRPEDVPDLVNEIRAALGDESRFAPIYAELHGPRLKQPEAVAIACEVSGYTSPGTKKSQALKRIQKAHQNIVDFRRSAPAAGRAAA